MAKQKTMSEKAKTEFRRFVNNMSCPTLEKVGRNLTLMYLDGKLDPCYHRDAPITSIQKILLRKSKPNVLLTGPAGCGKTAIAEGVAAVLAERAIKQTEQELLAEEAYKRLGRLGIRLVTLRGKTMSISPTPNPSAPKYPRLSSPTAWSTTFLSPLWSVAQNIVVTLKSALANCWTNVADTPTSFCLSTKSTKSLQVDNVKAVKVLRRCSSLLSLVAIFELSEQPPQMKPSC